MNRKIVALPVDGRPAVREQVAMLAAIAGWELLMPPAAALGHFREPADRHSLRAWLAEQMADADGLVLSIDMLVYGGLVPSRFIEDDLASLREALRVIEEIKHAYPAKPIFAFAATMRISNNNVNEEEKVYWADYGEAIWRWSYFADRFSVKRDPYDKAEADAAMVRIPVAVREDYLATRARNLALTRDVIGLLERGVIDRLILPQDDTAEFGFNIAERRQLQSELSQRGLMNKAAIYPGADEVIHTLSARMISVLAQQKPLSFFVLPGEPDNIETLRALYEDRPITESIASQIAAVGAVITQDAREADVILAAHTRGRAQGDWAMRKPLENPAPVSGEWLQELAAFHQQGKAIAVADLAYANGGDPDLIDALAGVLPLNQLAAYAGWNTASNTIGSLVAQCVLAWGSYANAANSKTRASRLLEDFLYQSEVRQTVRASVDERSLTAQALHDVVGAKFIPRANAWAREHALGWKVASIYLPWYRTFEIGINLVEDR